MRFNHATQVDDNPHVLVGGQEDSVIFAYHCSIIHTNTPERAIVQAYTVVVSTPEHAGILFIHRVHL